MYTYSIPQWLLIFYFYCFFGWCFESTYVSLKKGKCVNRGFMRGPFLPLYGTGACMMLIVSFPFRDNLLLTFLAGCIGATVLEFITGVLMETLFKVRYWDYSNLKWNYKGHICVSSTLAWGGLTILMTRVIHHPVEQLLFLIPVEYVAGSAFLLSILLAGDFALSFKAAIDLRDLLIMMEKAKDELERLQKRLDVVVALANEELENKKIPENIKEELAELKVRFKMGLEYRVKMIHIKDFYRRHLIKGNPGMVSGRFKEALQELKDAVNEHRKK